MSHARNGTSVVRSRTGLCLHTSMAEPKKSLSRRLISAANEIVDRFPHFWAKIGSQVSISIPDGRLTFTAIHQKYGKSDDSSLFARRRTA